MTTNQTEYEHNLAWYRRHSLASPGFRMSGSDSEAKRESLRREAMALVLDDRFCFLAKQSWEFQVENKDAVIRGQWGKVKFNKPRDDRSDGESYLMKCFAGGLLSDLCVICHGNRYVSNPNGKFPDACHNCNFSERITGDRYGTFKEPQTKTDDGKENHPSCKLNDANSPKGRVLCRRCQSDLAGHKELDINWVVCATCASSGKSGNGAAGSKFEGIELIRGHGYDEKQRIFDFDVSGAEGLEHVDRSMRPFKLTLQGEVFEVGACELRDLLRAHKVGKAFKPEGLKVIIDFGGGCTREEIIYPREFDESGGKDEQ